MCYYAILMSRELLLCLPCAMTVQGQEKEAKEKPPQVVQTYRGGIRIKQQ